MKKHNLKFVALAVSLLVGTLLLTTRLGVWLFLDILGSLDEKPLPLDPSAGPVAAAPFGGSIASLAMPSRIQQPSGITFDPRTRTWVISTDQAELFVLDESMTRVLSRSLVLRTLPLWRQGLIEAVAFVPGDRQEDDRLAFIGETDTMEFWRRRSDGDAGWASDSSVPLESEIADLEAAALAFDHSTAEFYVASPESSILYTLDLSGRIARRMDLDSSDRWPPGAIKSGRRVDELWISGLTMVDGQLWAVSENYTTLLQLDPRSGKVLTLRSLPELGEASDLAIVEGSAVFTIDHNWNEPRPSFRRIAVPTTFEPMG